MISLSQGKLGFVSLKVTHLSYDSMVRGLNADWKVPGSNSVWTTNCCWNNTMSIDYWLNWISIAIFLPYMNFKYYSPLLNIEIFKMPESCFILYSAWSFLKSSEIKNCGIWVWTSFPRLELLLHGKCFSYLRDMFVCLLHRYKRKQSG